MFLRDLKVSRRNEARQDGGDKVKLQTKKTQLEASTKQRSEQQDEARICWEEHELQTGRCHCSLFPTIRCHVYLFFPGFFFLVHGTSRSNSVCVAAPTQAFPLLRLRVKFMTSLTRSAPAPSITSFISSSSQVPVFRAFV